MSIPKKIKKIIDLDTEDIDPNKIFCEKCKSLMREEKPDLEKLSEGQMTEYEAGLWRTYRCPQCDHFQLVQGHFTTYNPEDDIEEEEKNQMSERGKEQQKIRSSILVGFIGEYWIIQKLKEEGYVIGKLKVRDCYRNVYVSNPYVYDIILKDHPQKKEITDLLNSITKGQPDLICLKDGKISFVEVKTAKSDIKPYQKDAFNILKKAGYDVNVRTIKVEYNVTEVPNTSRTRIKDTE